MGFNKGDTYEEKIFQICKKNGIVPENSKRAGASGSKADLTFIHQSIQYKLEIKDELDSNADYGQRRIHFSPKDKTWKWAIKDELSELYKNLGLNNKIPKNFIPIWYQKREKKVNEDKYSAIPGEIYTKEDRKLDQSTFNQDKISIPREALFLYYKLRDTYYIQIKGSGLFHLEKDIANIGTQKFDGDPHFRFRVKIQSSKKPPHQCQFIGVIKLNKKNGPKKSKFNLDVDNILEGQTFPKIIP